MSKQAHRKGPRPHLQPGQEVVVVEQGAGVHVDRELLQSRLLHRTGVKFLLPQEAKLLFRPFSPSSWGEILSLAAPTHSQSSGHWKMSFYLVDRRVFEVAGESEKQTAERARGSVPTLTLTHQHWHNAYYVACWHAIILQRCKEANDIIIFRRRKLRLGEVTSWGPQCLKRSWDSDPDLADSRAHVFNQWFMPVTVLLLLRWPHL